MGKNIGTKPMKEIYYRESRIARALGDDEIQNLLNGLNKFVNRTFSKIYSED